MFCKNFAPISSCGRVRLYSWLIPLYRYIYVVNKPFIFFFFKMHHNFYQSSQIWIDTRVAIFVWIGWLVTGLRTAILAKRNQTRNERYLAYQFKLRSLDKKWDKIVEKAKSPIDLIDISSWVNTTNPKHSIDNLLLMFKNKESYVLTLDKMKKEFWIDDI
jgi:hypothetical protein